jgi:hypothetical protein
MCTVQPRLHNLFFVEYIILPLCPEKVKDFRAIKDPFVSVLTAAATLSLYLQHQDGKTHTRKRYSAQVVVLTLDFGYLISP